MLYYYIGCRYYGYEAANSLYINYHYGSMKSCFERCQKTSKCVGFMYRHSDSICWLNSSRKKLNNKVQGVEFVEMTCGRVATTTKKPATTTEKPKGNRIIVGTL